MRSITRLFGVFGTLADSLLSLSGVIDAATAKLRLQLASETEPAALPLGEVIDGTTAEREYAVEAESSPSPSASTKGRKTKASA
ncbi:MAG TPA: hypothetical protein VMG10_13060 [Gemmataceae bacterium]|nr:hypothetical protein [Gemmataceae bacterium]